MSFVSRAHPRRREAHVGLYQESTLVSVRRASRLCYDPRHLGRQISALGVYTLADAVPGQPSACELNGATTGLGAANLADTQHVFEQQASSWGKRPSLLCCQPPEDRYVAAHHAPFNT